MNETSERATSATQPAARTEVRFLDLLIILAGSKNLIFGFALLTAVTAAVASLALPDRYAASTQLMPAGQSRSITSTFVNQLSNLMNALAGDSDVASKNDLYLGILRSRVVANGLVDRFHLMQVYGTSSHNEARARLKADTRITDEAGGLIRVEVEGHDAALVAPLANAYAAEANNVVRSLEIAAAARQRVVLERELASARTRLATAEAVLKSGIDDKGVRDVESEAVGAARVSAQLLEQISAVQTKLEAMQAFLTPNHPTYQHTEAELLALRSHVAKLQRQPASADRRAISSRATRNIESLREVKYYETLSGLLSTQYELARLDEKRPIAPLQILDSAIEPERKHGPARSVIVLSAGLTGLFLACTWAFVSAAGVQTQRETRNVGIVSGAGAEEPGKGIPPFIALADRYHGGSMRKTTWQWMAMVLAVALLSILGIKRFEPWPQVLDLWESGVSPVLLAASGHPHFFRFMTSYVGFLMEEMYPAQGFSLYISFFFAANILLWKRISLMFYGRIPQALAWAGFLGGHFFMNGRGVIAWTAWLLCASICLRIAAGRPGGAKRMLLTALACWLAAVSTGVFVVVVVALVMFYLQYRRRERVGPLRKGLMMVIAMPIMYVVMKYFMVAVSKNIEFYGGGWQGMLGMLAHGVGKILLGSEILAVLIVAFSAFFLLFLITLVKMRKQVFTPLEKLLGCAAFGGLFGFTVLTLVLPLAFLYRSTPRKCDVIDFRSETKELA